MNLRTIINATGIAATAIAVAAIMILLDAASAGAHESPIDHVERSVRFTIQDGRLDLRYRVEFAERSVMLQLLAMDADRNGDISDEERRRYFDDQARRLATRLRLTIGDRSVALEPQGDVACDAGLGQTFHFSAPLAALSAGRHRVQLADYHARYAPGPYRLLQPPPASPNEIRIELKDRPQLVDLERHPGLVVVEFEVIVPEAAKP